jgi:hypothetical protein
MNKWVDYDDRNWPKDIPADYFEDGKYIKIGALPAFILSLIRRVEELEREVHTIKFPCE